MERELTTPFRKTGKKVPQLDKEHLQYTYSYHTLDSERLNGFSLQLRGGETRISTVNILRIMLLVLASAIIQENEMKDKSERKK